MTSPPDTRGRESGRDHISVCVCTYRRPAMLMHLLERLRAQEAAGRFDYSIVVVDNDVARSAESVVRTFENASGTSLSYDCEPEQNIALARNRAVRNSRGNYLALIDDDEFPGDDWLLQLHRACDTLGVDGVLGPVIPRFEEAAPAWVVRGGFYSKAGHATGDRLEWQDTRTSNALIRRSVFDAPASLFRKELGRGGEDKDFFQRAIDRGCVFAWTSEAPVYESIPVERCRRSFMIRRALLRGRVTLCYSKSDWTYVAKSFVAVPLYATMLPFSLLLGHHNFMKTMIRLSEHAGRLAAWLGFDVIRQYYVTK